MFQRKLSALFFLVCLVVSLCVIPGALAAPPDLSITATVNGQNVAVQVTGNPGEGILFSWPPTGATNGATLDGSGTYSNTFTNVPEGTYTLTVAYTASPAPGNSASQSVTIQPPPTAAPTVAPTTEPTTAPTTAPIVTPPPPPPTGTIALVITSVEPGTQRVAVRGAGKAGEQIKLSVQGVPSGNPVIVDANGSFSFVNVPVGAGNYTTLMVEYVSYGGNAAIYNTPFTVRAPVNLTIASATLVGRDQLRVIGNGAANGSAKLDLAGGPSKNFAILADGSFDETIPNIPVGTFHSVSASYVGSMDSYGNNSGPFSNGSPWIVVPATSDDLVITRVTPSIGQVIVEGKGKAGIAITATVGNYSGGTNINNAGTFSIKITLPAGTYNGAQVKYNTSPAPGNNASTAEKIVVPDPNTTLPPNPGTYPTLMRGMQNSQVTSLQNALKSLGFYTIKVDGIFGVGTQTAVRNFQVLNGLTATGIADDAMQKVLYSGNAKGLYPNPTPGGYDTLRYGSRGTAVRNLQSRLGTLGYYFGSIDGIFGSQSESAVRRFQNRNNLAVTGVADSQTQSVIYSSSAVANSNQSSGYVYLHYGSRGAAVTRLQTALKNTGYYKGVIDGQYYDQTYSAVKSFQRANGLVVDGLAGKKTQNKLYGTNY